MSAPASLAEVISCLSDYDPNALSVEQARGIIRSFVEPVAVAERVAVRASLGRVLAEDIVSPIDVPAHDNSAMDGFAVRGSDLRTDTETRLRRIGEAFAGRVFEGTVQAGECVRVMTGAVMPAGTDTVVIQEIAQSDGDWVVIAPGTRAGDNRRFAGEDLARGRAVLHPGQLIGPAELGLIASIGVVEVSVKRRLRVAFFSTGDELASVGQPLAAGQVYDSNRYTLFGMLSRLGVEVIDMGVVGDDPASLERALCDAAACADAVITTGGVSVGEADFIRALLARLGEVVFWKIAMRPGRPMAFGRIGAGEHSASFFGLPGNPVAVMVTFYQFVREALALQSGRGGNGALALPLVQARSAAALRKKPGRTEYQRGVLACDNEGRWSVRLTGQQGSGVLRSMSEANCFIVLEHERGNVEAGEPVTVQLFEGLV